MGICGKDSVLSRVCSSSCLTGCGLGMNAKRVEIVGVELCHSQATVSHLERVAGAGFKVFPVVSSSPTTPNCASEAVLGISLAIG